MDLDLQRTIPVTYLGFLLQGVTDKEHPFLTGFFVKILPEAVGANVPIEYVDIHLWLALFEPEGALH